MSGKRGSSASVEGGSSSSSSSSSSSIHPPGPSTSNTTHSNGHGAVSESTVWQDVVVQYNKVLNTMALDHRARYAALGGKKGNVYITDLEEPWEFARSLSYTMTMMSSSNSNSSGSANNSSNTSPASNASQPNASRSSSSHLHPTSGIMSGASGGDVTALAWNPHLERSSILAAAAGKDILLYNIDDRRSAMHTVLQTHQRPVADLSWSLSDPNVLATCSADTYINLWDFRDTRRPVRLKSLCGWTTAVHQVKFNRRNPFLLASAHDTEIRIWDIRRESQPVLKHVGAHAAPITQLEWLNAESNHHRGPASSHSASSDVHALILMTASQDRSLKLWAVPTHVASGSSSSSNHELESAERGATHSLILLANTQFSQPIGRAKFAPASLAAGGICVAAATMKGSDYAIKFLSLSDAPPAGGSMMSSSGAINSTAAPLSFVELHSFAGHADIVSSLDWRAVGDSGAAIGSSLGTPTVQLASWSSRDQQFRLWCVPPTVVSKARNSAVPVSAAIASTVSYHSGQMQQQMQQHGASASQISSSPSGGSLSTSAIGALSLHRETPNLPQLLNPLPVPISVSASPGPQQLHNLHASSSTSASPQTISTLQDWEVASGTANTLEQELFALQRLNIVSQSLTSAPQQWLSVSFDEISPAKRTVVAVASISQQLFSSWPDLSEPASTPSNAAIRLRIMFPSLYPHSASPSVEIQSLLLNNVNVFPHPVGGSANPSPSPSPSSSFSSPLVSPSPSQGDSNALHGGVLWGLSPSLLIAWLSELKEAWAETNMNAVDSSKPCLHLLMRDSISFLRSFLLRLSKGNASLSAPATPIKAATPRVSESRPPPSPAPAFVDDSAPSSTQTEPLQIIEPESSASQISPTPALSSPKKEISPPVLATADSSDPTPLAVEDQQAYLQSAGEISLLRHQVAISLNSTASSPYNVPSGRPALEPRDSRPLDTPASMKSAPHPQGPSQAVMVSSARGAVLPETIDLEHNQAHMPAPRCCGAAWSRTGALTWWGRITASTRPSSDVNVRPQAPKGFMEFVEWKALVVSRSKELTLKRQQRVRELERLRHESETAIDDVDMLSSRHPTALSDSDADPADPVTWNSRVALIDFSSLLPASPFLARSYRLHGHLSVARLCSENAELARIAGRPDLVRAWSLLSLQANSSLDRGTWAFHPFGQKLVQELANHFEQMGDVQTLAMMACVLSGPLHAPNAAVATSKAAINQTYAHERDIRSRAELAALLKQQQRERLNLMTKHHRQRAKLRQQLTLAATTDASALPALQGTLLQLRALQAKQIVQAELLLSEHVSQRRSVRPCLGAPSSFQPRPEIRAHPTTPLRGAEPLNGDSFVAPPSDRGAGSISRWNAESRDRRYRLVSTFGATAPLLYRVFRKHRYSRLTASLQLMSPLARAMWRRSTAPRFVSVQSPTPRATSPSIMRLQSESYISIDVGEPEGTPRNLSGASLETVAGDTLEQSRLEALFTPRIDTVSSAPTLPQPKERWMSLIDASDMIRFDVYKTKYADILLSWGLLKERAEVMKYLVSGDSRSSHAGPVFGVACRKCGGEVSHGAYCRQCACHAFECSLCRLPVKGASLFCMQCGHGGHSLHLREWFSAETSCPSGCGCQCQFEHNSQ
jgi:WD40 repeat protein